MPSHTIVASPAQLAAQPNMRTKQRNPYIYALDPIRVVTALAVLSVHVIGFSAVLNSSDVGRELQLGAGSALHFTREVFMFTTAFVLVYIYAGADFKLTTYLRKRGITVLIPYVVWSVFYIAFNAWLGHVSLSPLDFVITTAKALLTGNASYQLYYVLLTLQFYALFPLLLRLVPWIRRHARRVLTASLIVELVVLALDFVFVENMHAPSIFPDGWAMRIDFYLHRFVLAYQFYFLLGVVAALNFDRVSAFLLAHGREIAAAFALALGAFWFNYAFSVWVGHNTADYAVAVLQPAMVPYSVVVLAFLGWLACRWAPPRGADAPTTPSKPYAARTWHTLADSTFGIYLAHPVFLTLALTYVAPALPTALPVPLRVLLLWLLVASTSVGACVLLLRTPGLSSLVGRPSTVPALDSLRGVCRGIWGGIWNWLAAHLADAHPAPARPSGPSGKLAGPAFAVQGVGQLPLPVRSRTTLPLDSRRLRSSRLGPSASTSGQLSGPRHRGFAADVRDDVWAGARHLAASGEGDGGWDVVRRAHDDRDDRDDVRRRRIGDGPNQVRPRGDAAGVSISSEYPSRPLVKHSDRQQRIHRAQQLRQEGWRQREIADALGVSRSTISHWLAHSPPTQQSVGAQDAKGTDARNAEDGICDKSDRAVVSGELRGGNMRIGEGE